jgi:hypothetical protein
LLLRAMFPSPRGGFCRESRLGELRVLAVFVAGWLGVCMIPCATMLGVWSAQHGCESYGPAAESDDVRCYDVAATCGAFRCLRRDQAQAAGAVMDHMCPDSGALIPSAVAGCVRACYSAVHAGRAMVRALAVA